MDTLVSAEGADFVEEDALMAIGADVPETVVSEKRSEQVVQFAF